MLNYQFIYATVSAMHILTVAQYDHAQLELLFKRAEELRSYATPTQRRELAQLHQGKQLCSLFYEPSTRTRLSFETGAIKMGMGLVSTENAREFSSASKGETIEDTIRVLDEYKYDAIVLRHHETGAAARAASVSKTPIINAGDGKGEHPTQALLDAYTIYRKFGRLNNLHIVMGGDLANGRTVRSLAQLLSTYRGNRITFVSVPELQIGDDIKATLQANGTRFSETAEMLDALKSADVVYWTRLQKERLAHPEAIPQGGFILDTSAIEILPKNAIIMHPLPRVDEIDPAIDSDPRSLYFEQAGNGLYARMALIDQILIA
jgi:aspartate carbamoyltransferase catalytic subunit